ncbi:hypothetical protein [Stutzerimonas xanthomarina]
MRIDALSRRIDHRAHAIFATDIARIDAQAISAEAATRRAI